MDIRHQCAADGCKRTIPAERLMCIYHWRVVPKDIQNDVWAAYRARDPRKPETLRTHAEACVRAVRSIRKPTQGRLTP